MTVTRDRRWSTCPSEYQLTTRNGSQRLDDGFALTRLHPGFERYDGVSGKNPDALLTHDSSCVVLGIDEMHRCTGLRLTASKHRFEHVIPEHTLPAEFGKQSRMCVQNARGEGT